MQRSLVLFWPIKMQGCNWNNWSSPVRKQQSWDQFNKTFTSVIYKCSCCFRVLSQGPMISYSAPEAREGAHSGGRVGGTLGTRLIARLVLASLKVSGQVFLASLCLTAFRFCYVTKMHWPRRPRKTPYRDKAMGDYTGHSHIILHAANSERLIYLQTY